MIILFLSHILGDYYFQSDNLAKKKQSDIWFLLLHSLIYSVCLFLLPLLMYENVILWPIAIISVSHLIVDLISSGVLGFRIFPKNVFLNHSFDQLIHYSFLIGIAILFSGNFIFRSWVISLLATNEFTEYGIVALFFIGCILFVLKPVKLIVDDLLLVSIGNQTDPIDNKKSVYLGYLERIITFISLIMGTWIIVSVLIGFKTWAQSERLKKESDDFPKRYVIGTLASIIPAIIIAILFIWYLSHTDLAIIQIA